MGVLKTFLFVCAGAFALGGLVVGGLLMKVTWLLGLPVLLLGLGLGWATYKGAQKFGQQADVHQSAQFEQTFRQLAEKNGGSVAFDAVLRATGESKDAAQVKLRELVGRGVCEMDFGPNGELLYKLTPFDEARANLARLSDKA